MMYILFNDILQLQFFLTFSSLLFHKDARSEYGGLTIYDDAFKNYLWVKVFDDNAFAIIKSHFSFSFVCVLTWSLLGVRSISFRGLIQNFRRASVPPSYAESPPRVFLQIELGILYLRHSNSCKFHKVRFQKII